jgi:hypothetical protein
MRGAKATKTGLARRLRKKATIAETKLWWRLRSRGLNGFKFVRQEPIGPYVAALFAANIGSSLKLTAGNMRGASAMLSEISGSANIGIAFSAFGIMT